jgi:Mce-associated membrane protein
MAQLNVKSDRADSAADVTEPNGTGATPEVEVTADPTSATPTDSSADAEPDTVAKTETGNNTDPEADARAEPAAATAEQKAEAATEPKTEVEPAPDAEVVVESVKAEAETAKTETAKVERPAEADSSARQDAGETTEFPQLRALVMKRTGRGTDGTVVALVAVLVLLWIGGTLLFLSHRSTLAQQPADQQILVTARQVVSDLTSIGGANAQQTITRLSQETTGRFHDQISSDAGAAQTLLQQSNTGSTGTVTASGIEQSDASNATALLTVTSVVSNNKLPNAQTLSFRFAIKLQQVDNRWLASDISVVK